MRQRHRKDLHAVLRLDTLSCLRHAGSKIDIAGLRSRAHREDFPTQFSSAKNDSTLICLRKGQRVSEKEHTTVS